MMILHTSGKGRWTSVAKEVTVTDVCFESTACTAFVSDWDKKDGLIYTDPLFLDELLSELRDWGYDIDIDYSEYIHQSYDRVRFNLLNIRGEDRYDR